MKKNYPIWAALLAGALLLPAVARAQQDATNRLTFSARFGFNLSARFKGFGAGAPAPGSRTTPRGDAYNYDDGYVLTDVSGNFGGQTWYWGYDNSASQISGNTILLNRSTVAEVPATESSDSEPYLGAELTFNRELGQWGSLHYGVEAAVNYMNLSVHDNQSFATRVTDAYPFTPGTTPPAATPSHPYQGSYDGPGFVIGDTPVSSTTTTLGHRELDTDIWGFRLGPYLELPLRPNLDLSVSGGLALGLLESTVSWTKTVSVTPGGSTHSLVSASDFDAAWGGYLSANVSWQLSRRWSAEGGLQLQDLGTYEHSFNGQKIQLNLANSVFVTIGVTYCF